MGASTARSSSLGALNRNRVGARVVAERAYRQDMAVNQHSRRIGVPVVVAIAGLTLAACSANQDPASGPGTADNSFCTAMASATEAAPRASEALNALFDEMEKPEYLSAGADVAPLVSAGEAVTLAGNTYVTALTTAKGSAPEGSGDDFDAIIDYWKLYGIALGDYASSATDFGGFVDMARPLIESDTSATLLDEQRAAALAVTETYAAECSA